MTWGRQLIGSCTLRTSLRTIAAQVRASASTVKREVDRMPGAYQAARVNKAKLARRPRLKIGSTLRSFVVAKLSNTGPLPDRGRLDAQAGNEGMTISAAHLPGPRPLHGHTACVANSSRKPCAQDTSRKPTLQAPVARSSGQSWVEAPGSRSARGREPRPQAVESGDLIIGRTPRAAIALVERTTEYLLCGLCLAAIPSSRL